MSSNYILILTPPLTMDDNFLSRAAIYTNGDLPHQLEAFQLAQSKLSDDEIAEIARIFRRDPANIFSLSNFKLLSQRGAVGDWNGDGRLDKFQTCQVTCTAMVINYLTGKKTTPKELDWRIRSEIGDRYNHNNLVKLMALYGVHSMFRVDTTHDDIKDHLRSGKPVIWSNKLTHGGHLVVITGFDDDNFCYRIHDPYGEPFPVNKERTKWHYKDIRKPYKLSYDSFNTVNANGFNYLAKTHWAHLCKAT